MGIDATTLEANAALRSIVRRDTGEGYETFLHGLAEASGIPTPTRAELARFDRKRPKKGSNDDWTHPQDPDATITRTKDGRTRLAHKAEHAVDLETSAVIGVTVQDADAGDTQTMVETLITAAEQVEAVLPAGPGLAEVVGDKGYHSNETLVALAELGLRSYVSEPARGQRRWRGKPRGACGRLRQPAADSGRPREAPAAPAGRTPRASPRPSLRNRTIAPRASARTCQRAQASAGARLRLESGPAHAATDGCRDAAQPPGPRWDPHLRPDPRPQPPLAPRSAFRGGSCLRSGRFVVDCPRDTASSTRSAHATRKRFCHSLLGDPGSAEP